MKMMYDRMSKDKKREVLLDFKNKESYVYNKINRIIILCYVGIIYSIIAFIYDYFYKKTLYGYLLDIIIIIFCVIALIKYKNTKRELLNDYVYKNKKRF